MNIYGAPRVRVGERWEEPMDDLTKKTPRSTSIIQRGIFEEVARERDRQDAKWGEQNHSDEYWLGIAMEEVGEVAKAVIERNSDAMFEEIIQTIAVLCQWIEAVERREHGS